jgi:ribonuclease P protein component
LNSVFGFPRALRLLHPAEFQLIFDSPTLKVGEESFLLLARVNELGHPRLGLVIAKRKVRRSVDRNRIKRRIRESFRLRQSMLPSVDVLLVAKQELSMKSSADLNIALDKAWKRLQKKHLALPDPATEVRQ